MVTVADRTRPRNGSWSTSQATGVRPRGRRPRSGRPRRTRPRPRSARSARAIRWTRRQPRPARGAGPPSMSGQRPGAAAGDGAVADPARRPRAGPSRRTRSQAGVGLGAEREATSPGRGRPERRVAQVGRSRQAPSSGGRRRAVGRADVDHRRGPHRHRSPRGVDDRSSGRPDARGGAETVQPSVAPRPLSHGLRRARHRRHRRSRARPRRATGRPGPGARATQVKARAVGADAAHSPATDRRDAPVHLEPGPVHRASPRETVTPRRRSPPGSPTRLRRWHHYASPVPSHDFPAVRLHIVTGKGGTGKSTVAAALALALASTGQERAAVRGRGPPGHRPDVRRRAAAVRRATDRHRAGRAEG